MTEVVDDEGIEKSTGWQWPGVPAWCEHGPGAHDGTVVAAASAPVAARAWLLIEHPGPWAHSAIETALPGRLAALAADADRAGIRVQLIRRPSRASEPDRDPSAGPVDPAAGSESSAAGSQGPAPGLVVGPAAGLDSPAGSAGSAASPENPAAGPLGPVASSESSAAGPESLAAGSGDPAVYAAWTAGPQPWLARVAGAGAGGGEIDLAGLARGVAPTRATAAGPLYLVCAHARRDRCCGRFGGPLARGLAARYPEQVWETTHLGGHKYAPNLALLPDGRYYGPADLPSALAAIEAYQRGEVMPHRYRGRAGHDEAWQRAEQASLTARTPQSPGNPTGN